MSLDKDASGLKNKAPNIHQELINACCENDQKAQIKIYKLYYKAMYNTALRIVNDTMEAEDVMQEAFLAAFQKIHQYDKSATFGAWLKRIVINKSLDVLDKKKKNIFDINAEVEEVQDIVGEDYFEVLSYKIEIIRKMIESLVPAYRIIISLHLIEGYEHKEISEILGISYNAVRTKYSRAKQKLLALLKQHDISKTVNLN